MKQPQIQIRRANPSDAAAISTLLHEAFLEYKALYTGEGFAATVLRSTQVRDRMKEGPVWLAFNDAGVLATGSAIRKGESLYIRGVAVHPAARGSGIGKMLLQTIQEFATAIGCKQLLLTTTPFLIPAICLYEGFGFERVTEGPNDLFGTPLFAMRKTLSE